MPRLRNNFEPLNRLPLKKREAPFLYETIVLASIVDLTHSSQKLSSTQIVFTIVNFTVNPIPSIVVRPAFLTVGGNILSFGLLGFLVADAAAGV